MKQRIKQMSRVAEMRALRERICEAASVRAAGELRVVERSLQEAQAARLDAIDESRQAIVDDDRPAWMLADAMREVAGWNQAQLETMRVSREAELTSKLQVFRHSRMQREQSDRIVETLCAFLAETEARLDQAQSDDRFGARLHWNAARETMKPR